VTLAIDRKCPRITAPPLLGLLLAACASCGGSLPPDNELIGSFQAKKASYEQLRQLAYEDLPGCRDQIGWPGRCPPFQTMSESRYKAYLAAARDSGGSIDQIRFVAVILDPTGTTSTPDVCLEVVIHDTGFPIPAKRKSIRHCETEVPSRLQCSDLDEYIRDHDRTPSQGLFRRIEAGWYLYYTPL